MPSIWIRAMKYPAAMLSFLLLVAALCGHPARAADIDLFVMAGQSNMQGWQGNAEGYPFDPNGIDGKVRFYWVTPGFSSSSGEWTHLQSQGGLFAKGHFGPEVTFGRCLVEAGFTPAIFKFSLGSTSLAEDWKALGQNGMYDHMIQELIKARALLQAQGHSVKVRGLVWIQGESDAGTRASAEGYGKRLKALIKHFRGSVATDPRTPIILGVDEQHPWVMQHPQVVTQQQAIADGDANIVFTSMRGLQKADVTHLTPEGLKDHGRRLFSAFIKLDRPDQKISGFQGRPVIADATCLLAQ